MGHGSKPVFKPNWLVVLNVMQVSDLTLGELNKWKQDVLAALPSDIKKMATSLFESLMTIYDHYWN